MYMKMPYHVAIIMDGNGRWANKRGLPRIAGHKIGLESVRAVIKGCSEKKIEVLTLFAFSTENWERPKDEVGYLTGQLLVKALEEEMDELHKSGVQLRVIGEIWRLDNKLQQEIADSENVSAACHNSNSFWFNNNPGYFLFVASRF